MNIVCIALNVDVVEGDAFLICGAYERISKVTGQGETNIVLNIAIDMRYLHEIERPNSGYMKMYSLSLRRLFGKMYGL